MTCGLNDIGRGRRGGRGGKKTEGFANNATQQQGLETTLRSLNYPGAIFQREQIFVGRIRGVGGGGGRGERSPPLQTYSTRDMASSPFPPSTLLFGTWTAAAAAAATERLSSSKLQLDRGGRRRPLLKRPTTNLPPIPSPKQLEMSANPIPIPTPSHLLFCASVSGKSSLPTAN